MTVYVAHENVLPGARVINASTGETIKGVVRIDTEGCTVEALAYPLRVVGDEVVTRTIRFSSIDVVFHWGIAEGFNCNE